MGLEMAVNQGVSAPPPTALAGKPAPGADGTLPKGKFGEFIGVSPGRVSQYIAAGKIFGDAITKDGRIHVETAKSQLLKSLDASQMTGNGLDTKLRPGETVPAATSSPSATPAPASEPLAPIALVDTVEDQIKRARLEGIEYDNRRKAEDAAARAGRYVDAESVKQMFGRQAGQMVAEFEARLADFATDLASHFKIPQRDVLHRLRNKFRDARAATASSLNEVAAALPAAIEDVSEAGDTPEE